MAEESALVVTTGVSLTDADWLGQRLTETAHTWGCHDQRVIGTLWWYIVSFSFLTDPLRQLDSTGHAPDPSLAGLTCAVRGDGTLERFVSRTTVAGVGAYGRALHGTFAEVIDTLTTVSGAGRPSLWAVTADSIGNCALAATGDHDRAADLAVNIAAEIGDVIPTPRFVDVGRRRFVHRSSCCLIYVTGRADKCVSCPRRTPEERAGLLSALERSGR